MKLKRDGISNQLVRKEVQSPPQLHLQSQLPSQFKTQLISGVPNIEHSVSQTNLTELNQEGCVKRKLRRKKKKRNTVVAKDEKAGPAENELSASIQNMEISGSRPAKITPRRRRKKHTMLVPDDLKEATVEKDHSAFPESTGIPNTEDNEVLALSSATLSSNFEASGKVSQEQTKPEMIAKNAEEHNVCKNQDRKSEKKRKKEKWKSNGKDERNVKRKKKSNENLPAEGSIGRSLRNELLALDNSRSCLHTDCSCDCKVICNSTGRVYFPEGGGVDSSKEENSLSIRSANGHKKELDAVILSPERGFVTRNIKKLLVLDLNGLLADVVLDYRKVLKAEERVGSKAVFKRPFCDEFLKFCFERFKVGVWSSRKRENVYKLVDYLMPDTKHMLLFCWDQSKCTNTGCKTVEDSEKPLVLKELKKLWNKEDPYLPWEIGEYSPSNTLLVDDSPYKALCNPPYTGIFPHPYCFRNVEDQALGPQGDLRVYLEGLVMAEDVQKFVQEKPFGQRAITSANPSWRYYLKIIERFQSSTHVLI